MLYNIFLTNFNSKNALFFKKIWIFKKLLLYLHREKVQNNLTLFANSFVNKYSNNTINKPL